MTGRMRDHDQLFADLAAAIAGQDPIQAEIKAGLILERISSGDTTGVDIAAVKRVEYLVASCINSYSTDKDRARQLAEEARSEWRRVFAPEAKGEVNGT